MERESIHNLSPKGREVWSRLGEKTKRDISKGNVFKYDRNRRIAELKSKGIPASILAELSGLDRASIFRIVKKETLIPEGQRREIKALADTFNQLLRSIARLLSDPSRRGENGDKKSTECREKNNR